MSPIVIQTISIIIAIVVFLAGMGASFAFLISKYREKDMATLRATNKDQGDRIDLLEKAVSRLEGQVDSLEKKNKTLEDLVTIALKQYFFEHPDIAKTMQDKVLG